MNSTHQVQDVIVVGTGFAGLCMGIALKQMGTEQFFLLERANEVGGTWRDNEYPGAACDVPSHLYSLSFFPKADWSRKYPTQPELYAYLKGIATEHQLYPHIRFNENLISATYLEGQKLWQVTTTQGKYLTRSLIMGTGGLAEPKLPEIPGVESFEGKTFHSARWDHSYDLAGKRVAVIGSGASAIQIVPELVKQAGEVTVFQRTPNWIIPRLDRPYTRLEKALFKYVPGARRLHRTSIYWGHEARVMGMVIHPALMQAFQKIAEFHIKRQVKDQALRQQVTPDYLIGCRRILISNNWYPALQANNCRLNTDGIRAITATGIVTAAGETVDVDAIVFATGFYATENPIAHCVTGPNNTLAEAWQDGEEAYLGTTIAGFPNLYMIIGPNTGLGHTSMIFMIEQQVKLIKKLLAHKAEHNAATLAVKPSVQQAFNRKLQSRLQRSVWATGCDSWYKHRNGKITALWPGFTFEFWWRTQQFNAQDYELNSY